MPAFVIMLILASPQLGSAHYVGGDEEWYDPSSGLSLTIDLGHDKSQPLGQYVVSWHGRKWRIDREERGRTDLDLVVVPSQRRIVSLSSARFISCMDYAGKVLWSDSLGSDSDPGNLIVADGTVMYDIGVIGNPAQAGYGDEAGALRHGYCEVVARDLLSGKERWREPIVSVGLPIAPAPRRMYIAIYEDSPLRRMSEVKRSFWLTICKTASHSVVRSFRIPALASRRLIDLYQFGLRLRKASSGPEGLRYQFREDLYEFSKEGTLYLKLDNALTRAEWVYGRHKWVTRGERLKQGQARMD